MVWSFRLSPCGSGPKATVRTRAGSGHVRAACDFSHRTIVLSSAHSTVLASGPHGPHRVSVVPRARISRAPRPARTCGAPLDARNVVERLRMAGSAPAARYDRISVLATPRPRSRASWCRWRSCPWRDGDGVFFEHHVMLWKDEQTPLGGAQHRRWRQAQPRRDAVRGVYRAGTGPGPRSPGTRSRASWWCCPLHPGMELDVRERAFLVASHSITYSFVRIKGLANVLHGGGGMYMDRFVTEGAPGDVDPARKQQRLRAFARGWREDSALSPAATCYKDSSVQMNSVQPEPAHRPDGPPQHVPGGDDRSRAGSAIQSMYVHHHSE